MTTRRPTPVQGLYVLDADGRTPVLEENVTAWGEWFETGNRHVAKTQIGNLGHISTVFLGIDHAFFGGPPILFETLGFLGLDEDEFFGRYSTWEEAEAGHWARVKEALALVEQTAATVADTLVSEKVKS